MAQAERLFLDDPKVAHWLTRYPAHPVVDASYADGTWTVNVFSGKAGEIATGSVDDASGAVTEAWTGPQAAWKMARGYPGAFGGVKLNSYKVWLSFCAIFLLGLIDWRRPLSAAEPRPARARLAVGVARSLQPRAHLRRDVGGVPAARLAARALLLDRPPRPAVARRRGLAGLGADRGDRLPRRASASASTSAPRT